jgi:hypothetical protein
MQLRTKAALVAAMLAVTSVAGYGAGVAQADQPHMQGALAELQAARGELIAAVPDKGGHRVNALNLVNQAIGEVRAGIAYAR